MFNIIKRGSKWGIKMVEATCNNCGAVYTCDKTLDNIECFCKSKDFEVKIK